MSGASKSVVSAVARFTALCIAFVAASVSAEVFVEGDLPRQAALGFVARAVDDGIEVRSVTPGSPAAVAGVAVGDRIVRVNGTRFDRTYVGENLLEKLREGQSVTLHVQRGTETHTIDFVPEPRPFESAAGIDSYYDVVDLPNGVRLRTIVTKPQGTRGRLPAIFFLQWVSCGSIEFREGSGSSQILERLARESGRALARVERTANGDSEGPGCHELDYDTELEHYVRAYTTLLSSPHVDRRDVVVYGSSLGSTTAPLLAHALQDAGNRIAGVIVQGGGAVTYYERMLNFDRWYLERRPEDVEPASIHAEMLRRARFHHEYLVRGRSPDDVARDDADMAAVRADVRGLGDGVHYGRPYAWHQQAARHNFLGAWAAIEAPMLVIFNEYDQFEARHGHRLIVDTVNRLRPGTATYVEQAGVGHSNRRYASVLDAYAGRDGENVAGTTAQVMLDWLGSIGTAAR